MDSKLQIISGAFRGRKLKVPATARPTQNRARIAVFNMLNDILKTDNLVVWDAFAGSGAFGLECLSRYAGATVIFTDVADESLRVLHDNLAALNVGARGRVVHADAIATIKKYAADVGLVFLDPPYADAELGASFVKRWAKFAKCGAILVWEQDNAISVTPTLPDVDILRDKKYGRARFLILQKK
ncbi:MAG: RsmD family RNA methyltransferase [Proteobacteria bacterium]|nr:RsmD family RNA methyltransferase [Candidatus Enterousia scatequi]